MGVDANFPQAIAEVLKDEGGYVNDPNDPGGETNFGISKRTFPNLDIAALTVDQAKAIYKMDFWDPNNYEKIIDPAIATKVFSFCVNMGPKEANKLLQRAVVSLGGELKVDGDLGPLSIASINACDPASLLTAFKADATTYYRLLVTEYPKDSEFIQGWLDRVND